MVSCGSSYSDGSGSCGGCVKRWPLSVFLSTLIGGTHLSKRIKAKAMSGFQKESYKINHAHSTVRNVATILEAKETLQANLVLA